MWSLCLISLPWGGIFKAHPYSSFHDFYSSWPSNIPSCLAYFLFLIWSLGDVCFWTTSLGRLLWSYWYIFTWTCIFRYCAESGLDGSYSLSFEGSLAHHFRIPPNVTESSDLPRVPSQALSLAFLFSCLSRCVKEPQCSFDFALGDGQWR